MPAPTAQPPQTTQPPQTAPPTTTTSVTQTASTTNTNPPSPGPTNTLTSHVTPATIVPITTATATDSGDYLTTDDNVATTTTTATTEGIHLVFYMFQYLTCVISNQGTRGEMHRRQETLLLSLGA